MLKGSEKFPDKNSYPFKASSVLDRYWCVCVCTLPRRLLT